MGVAKILEITATSPKNFEDAIRNGLERASQTVDHIEGAWIKEQKVHVQNGQVTEFRVDMKITFLLKNA